MRHTTKTSETFSNLFNQIFYDILYASHPIVVYLNGG